MERKEVASIKPSSILPGLLPITRRMFSAMRLCKSHFWIARATTTIEVAPGVVLGTFEGGGFGRITDYVFSSGSFKITGTGAVEGVIVQGSMENEIVDGDWVTVGSHALTEVSGWTYTPIE